MKNVLRHQAHPWGRVVLFTQDDKAIQTLAKKYRLQLDHDFTQTAEGLCWDCGPLIIWLRKGAGVDVLVHECTHATLDILEYAGIDAHSGNGEPMCYTLQRMVSDFLPHLLPPSQLR